MSQFNTSLLSKAILVVIDEGKMKFKVKSLLPSDSVKSFLNLKSDWTPGTEEHIYFLPGCSVPRFKVREKFKVTTKPENGTVAFCPSQPGGDEKFLDKKELLSLSPVGFQKFIGMNYGYGSGTYSLYTSLLNNYHHVYIDELSYREIFYNFYIGGQRATASFRAAIQTIPELEDYSYWGYHRNDHNYYYIPNIKNLERIDCDIYDQKAILSMLNEDKLIIDFNKYKDLRNMAESSDDENICLVMEIMANSNFEKSLVYLLILLREFQTKITSQTSLNHVNFKSLLEYIGTDVKTYNRNGFRLDNASQILRNKGQFTQSNIQILTGVFSHDYTGSWGDMFMEGPVLKPECYDLLDDE